MNYKPFIENCWQNLLKMRDQGKLGSLFIPGEPRVVWYKPSERMPERLSKVEVITYENEKRTGSFDYDDNWCIRGYPHDLFNSDIIKWRNLNK